MILAEAKNADQSVAIFFAPAEGTIFLHSFAELVSVDIKAESRTTIYQIRNLNVLPPNIRKSSLAPKQQIHRGTNTLEQACQM